MPGDLFSQLLVVGLIVLGTSTLALSLWMATTRGRMRRQFAGLRHEVLVSNGAAYNMGEVLSRLEETVNEMEQGAGARSGPVEEFDLSKSETRLLAHLRDARPH